MRPGVVYVHGIGNKVRAELLKSQWDKALFGKDLGDVTHMAYWASLRYDEPLPDDRRLDPLEGEPDDIEEVPEPAPPETAEEFITRTLGEARWGAGAAATGSEGRAPDTGPDPLAGWLREMTYRADTLAVMEGPEPAGDSPLELLPLPRYARQKIFRLLVRHIFEEAHAYFFGGAGPAIREVVGQVLDGLDKDVRLVVIGHSLGSVIAYDVLAEREQRTDLFLTLGSPLAIAEIQDHLIRPPAVPVGVRAWRNASDLRDLVALDHTIRTAYPPAERVADLLVTNDSRNHHGISAYLGSRGVRELVHGILADLAGVRIGWKNGIGE
ncbi:alpha/beta hydrolase family protein [Streptomyces jumonjinensis]|uniref:Alpha/beta hydrolase n=1 Tax=Streptomyces jumonjinensis TaxID=1945 RepID=A0A646KTE4_STRJU|nr:hypothetical protein [Streptomyces jumonjinensis]MQT05513.1 hypothetical protein [Streptomyces jumonjinensis]